ncbi:transposon Tf2-8 polyprotein [Trichonephila clavipes]|nr:transposon Tf2-8 polyprotein [Trichonephila clavipes]
MSKMLTKKESASVNAIHMFTCLTSPVALLDIEVYEATGTVCADTGASQSVGGELMFKFLRNRGQKFSEFHLAMCLADGQQSTSLVQKATVPITVGGRTFQIDLIFLPHAKVIDFPTRTANELRTEQLKDLELKKIIDCFENPNKGVDFANWTGRGYVMNQGVLYRYSPHAEVEEAQLVVPTHEREKILKLHHDAPTAAHYGADGTFSRISSKYYWTDPVPAQRFESIAIDLLVPYQKRPKLCFCLGYQSKSHSRISPTGKSSRKENRDLKPRLAMMVNNHTLWTEKLPAIRFAMNTSKCESTDHTAAYLTFSRELRTLDQVNTDLRSVIHNNNFVPEFTPYLKRFEGYMSQIKENIEMSQDRQKHMQINHADQVLTIKLMIWYG